MVQHAGHRNFEKLLRCGVRLIEYPSALLHQKIMTIDGVWCAVGTANFDDRSFETNDEITVAFIDAATAKRFDAIFERYAADGSEIELERWTGEAPLTSSWTRCITCSTSFFECDSASPGTPPERFRRRLPIEVASLTVR